MIGKIKKYAYDFAVTSDKWKLFYIIGSLALFIGLAYYVFSKYIEPRYSSRYVQNKEFVQEEPEPNYDVDVYLIYTTWCPHCKKLLDTNGDWSQIRNRWNGKKVKNKYRINFNQIDGDNTKEVKEFEVKYLNGNQDNGTNNVKIESYPTIYLIKDNQVIEFDANPTLDKFTNFLNSVI